MPRIATFLLVFSIFFLLLLFLQCQSLVSRQVRVEEEPFERLSEYRFFGGELKALQPNDRVLPYDLNTPLFSDYSEKARFIWMPEGSSAQYIENERFAFPAGTVLIKNFFYSHDQSAPGQGRKIVETRLLIRRDQGWEAMTYIWNETQTEAHYNIVGDILPVSWKDRMGEARAIDYVVPNRNQCKGCHAYRDELRPIGPKAANLNKSYAYADGETNQLVKWVETGYLSGFDPASVPPKMPAWDQAENGSLHDRAMAYLDVNCGHCHNPNGPAYTSGLDLTYDQEANINLGIWKAPVSAGKGTGGREYSIVPGQPDASILLYRMGSTDPGAMMPEIGRVTVHEEGVSLIREWIEGMMIVK